MADKDELDPTRQSGDAVDPADREASGSHALEPAEPAVAGVPADADEPTFRDRERLAAAADESDDQRNDRPDDQHRDDSELVTVGGGTQEQQAGAGVETTAASQARQKKEKATPRQKQLVETERRTGPVTFLRESVGELRKVVYPTGQQLINYFIVVLVFVLFIIAIVSVLDLAFGKAIIAVFS